MKTLVVIATINASDSDTAGFIEYYKNRDFIELIVFLDNPDHMNYDSVQRNKDWVRFIPCTPEHWEKYLGRQPENMPDKQLTNIVVGKDIAIELGTPWAISIDNDELIYPLDGLEDFLLSERMSSVETINLPPREAIFTRDVAYSSESFKTRFFKILVDPSSEFKKRRGTLSGRLARKFMVLRLHTRRGFLGHTEGKSIFRVDAPIAKYQQHFSIADENGLVSFVSPDFVILHFDAVNFDHWRNKWFRRTLGTTRAIAIGRSRKRTSRTVKWALRLSFLGADKKVFERYYVYEKIQIDALIAANLVVELDHAAQRRQ